MTENPKDKTGRSYSYIDEDGARVHVIDPARWAAMEMMEAHGDTLDDYGDEKFEQLVEHMRDAGHGE